MRVFILTCLYVVKAGMSIALKEEDGVARFLLFGHGLSITHTHTHTHAHKGI
jgi:hypothetical protein